MDPRSFRSAGYLLKRKAHRLCSFMLFVKKELARLLANLFSKDFDIPDLVCSLHPALKLSRRMMCVRVCVCVKIY